MTAWKVPKYRVISGQYFPVFSPNTGKYGPEITPYLDTFHAVNDFLLKRFLEKDMWVTFITLPCPFCPDFMSKIYTRSMSIFGLLVTQLVQKQWKHQNKVRTTIAEII